MPGSHCHHERMRRGVHRRDAEKHNDSPSSFSCPLPWGRTRPATGPGRPLQPQAKGNIRNTEGATLTTGIDFPSWTGCFVCLFLILFCFGFVFCFRFYFFQHCMKILSLPMTEASGGPLNAVPEAGTAPSVTGLGPPYVAQPENRLEAVGTAHPVSLKIRVCDVTCTPTLGNAVACKRCSFSRHVGGGAPHRPRGETCLSS